MTTNAIRKEPYAIGAPLVGASAILLTILTAVVVSQFKDGTMGQQFMDGLINRRGPTTYLILATAYNVTITLIVAWRWKGPLSTPCLMSYPLASLLPVLLGILGTLQGLAQVMQHLGASEFNRARLSVTLGVSFDPLLFGASVSLGLLYFSLLLIRKNRTSNNAIEPYS